MKSRYWFCVILILSTMIALGTTVFFHNLGIDGDFSDIPPLARPAFPSSSIIGLLIGALVELGLIILYFQHSQTKKVKKGR